MLDTMINSRCVSVKKIKDCLNPVHFAFDCAIKKKISLKTFMILYPSPFCRANSLK